MPADSVSKTERVEWLARRFRQLYGEGGVAILRAPARINILGEHVDYVSYLPTASLAFGSYQHQMLMAFRATGGGQVRGASMEGRFAPFSFGLKEELIPTADDQAWEEIVFDRPVPAPHWSNYVKGAVNFARWKHGAQITGGFDFLIDSTIPAASGASSSSALVVLAGAAIRSANRIEFTVETLARESSQAEWFLGTRGGALDHTTICLSKHGHAVHLSYAANRAELVSLPSGRFRWITFFTHPADKGRDVMLAYNERAAASRLLIPAMIAQWANQQPALAEAWRQSLVRVEAGEMAAYDDLEVLLSNLPEVMTLAEVRKDFPATFQKCEAAFPELVKVGGARPVKLRNRTLHHIGEARRVAQAVQLLRDCDGERQEQSVMFAVGELLNQSHASLRDLYEVSAEQVEQLVRVLHANQAVCGARLMGGGFGGNVLALVAAENVEAVIEFVQKEFYRKQDRDGVSEGSIMVSTPGDGLSSIEF